MSPTKSEDEVSMSCEDFRLKYRSFLEIREWKIQSTTLVQISFLKTLYFGQHNEAGAQINPIMFLNTLSLGVSRGYMQSLDPVILDSKMNTKKKEKGNLILQTAKTCPKS